MGVVVPIRTPVAVAYACIRDLTVLNADLSQAEAVAVLELVKAELLKGMLEAIHD